MRVLVTGAFGTLGRAAVRTLLADGHRVRCLDVPTRGNRRAARRLGDRVEVAWGDVRDAVSVAAAVAGQEGVIHDAALLPPATERTPELARAVNVEGTRNLLRALEAEPARPPVVFPSSITVFGPDPTRTRPVRPGDPVRATDRYTEHKLEAEAMLGAAAVPAVILRVAVSVDPATRSGDVEALGTLFAMDPDTRLEWIHPDDVARAQVNALDCREAWGRVWLVAGGPSCRVRLRDLVETLFAALGLGTVPAAAFGTGAFYTDWMDTDESQRLLAYQRHSFADFQREMAWNMRHLRLALLPFRPLVGAWLLRQSRAWREARASVARAAALD